MDVQHGSGLTPWAPKPDPVAAQREQRRRQLLFVVRYVVPSLIILAGLVVLVAVRDREVAWEVAGMFVGAGIAVFMLNFFFRMGVSGDRDRDREEAARAYFDKHGHWPGEGPAK